MTPLIFYHIFIICFIKKIHIIIMYFIVNYFYLLKYFKYELYLIYLHKTFNKT